MKQKKTMKLWQTAALLVLSAAILATMFLPAYRVDSDALRKGMEKAQTEEDKDKGEKDDKQEKKFDRFTNRFDKRAEADENKYEVDNNKITPLKLMTSSLSDIRYGGKEDDAFTESEMGKDIYDALNKKHRMTKILLWIVYILSALVILTMPLGYSLKLNKYIPLAVGTAYGVFAAIMFALLRFGTIPGIKKEVGELTENFLLGGKFKSTFDSINVDRGEIATGFISYAFLIGLILAAVLLIISVVSLFVGGQAETVYEDRAQEDDWENWGPPQDRQLVDPVLEVARRDRQQGPADIGQTISAPGMNGQGGKDDLNQASRIPLYPGGTVGETAPVHKIAPLSQTPQPQMILPTTPSVQEAVKTLAVRTGKVRCTRGMTSSPAGYALPQDRKVIVGKSPHQANLVIVNNSHISNVHCTVRYDAGADLYTVRDHSTNGTFVNGVRLPKEAAMQYPSGTILSLADGSVEIKLG